MTYSGYGATGNQDDVGCYNARLHYQVALATGFELLALDDEPKTIYVGNLDHSVTEEFIANLFGQIGTVKKAKLMFDSTLPYAFIEFVDHYSASQCVQAMNKRLLMNKEMKVSWVTEAAVMQPKIDTSNHFHVFVGDLSQEIGNKELQEAFARFGDISDTKVIRDMQTLKSKGYGFVSFPVREQAERAIEQMNGAWIGSRAVRTNWASRKPVIGETYSNSKPGIEEIFNQTGPDNTSVYVGILPQNCSDEEIRSVFSQFGDIVDIRYFKPQGYAFVRYATKPSAAKAISEMNGGRFMGQTVRCSWGKSEGPTGNRGDSSLAGAFNPANMQAYMDYYQQYYNSNPQLQQQWQTYWDQLNRTHGQGS